MRRTERHDIEAERLFLGCILLDPDQVGMYVDRVMQDDFCFECGLVWNGISALAMDRIMPTLLEVKSWLDKEECGSLSALEALGGEEFLDGLTEGVGEAGISSTRKAELFASRIRDASDRRIVAEVSEDLLKASERPAFDALGAWNEAIQRVIADRRVRDQAVVQRLGDRSAQLRDRMERWWHGQVVDCVPTGFWSLDSKLGGGLGNRQMIILAGAPGSMKTTLVEHFAMNQSACGYVVGISSVEMAAEDLMLRMATRDAGVDMTKLTAGEYNVDDEVRGGRARQLRRKMEESMARLSELPIFVDDRPAVSTAQIYFAALSLSLRHKVEVWYIDFADLVREDTSDTAERVRQVFLGSVRMARLLGIPVVVVSQVRKDVEMRLDKKPRADDVLYRGHDVADAVLLPWDVWSYAVTGDIVQSDLSRYRGANGRPMISIDENTMYMIVAKNRFGPKGTVCIGVDRATRRLSDPAGVTPRSYMMKNGHRRQERGGF